ASNRSPDASAIGSGRTDWAALSTKLIPCALQLSADRPDGPATTAEPAGAPAGVEMMRDADPAADVRWMICSAERLDTASCAPLGLIESVQLDWEIHSWSGAMPVVVQPDPLSFHTSYVGTCPPPSSTATRPLGVVVCNALRSSVEPAIVVRTFHRS